VAPPAWSVGLKLIFVVVSRAVSLLRGCRAESRGGRMPRSSSCAIAPTPVAIRPWPPLHSALQRYEMTGHETKKNSPHSREIPASGPFSRVVTGVVSQVLGSNHRRLSRRFYRPWLLPEAHAADQHIRDTRLDFWPPPSAMRPSAPGSEAARRGTARRRPDTERHQARRAQLPCAHDARPA
jgi:hypothetical protein